MGLIRKMMSVSSMGVVDFRSDKERTASYTKAAMKEAKKQTELQRQQAAQQAQHLYLAQRDAAHPAHQTAVEQGEFSVILVAGGVRTIQVIKEVRALTSLGLGEAKDLVEAAPVAVLEKVTKDTAEKARVVLERAGAAVTVSAAPIPPVEAGTVHPSAMDELGKLAELRAAGVVSQQEFDDAKARLLGSL
ncbi:MULTISPECIES: ribosomal protein L7/L12 [unclassified Modestobacter]|uniref:ribosomal protein L7/L12 n=1 Tax=unclassified Modestobacter TaxID=2643866 RepID=UPI002F26A782